MWGACSSPKMSLGPRGSHGTLTPKIPLGSRWSHATHTRHSPHLMLCFSLNFFKGILWCALSCMWACVMWLLDCLSGFDLIYNWSTCFSLAWAHHTGLFFLSFTFHDPNAVRFGGCYLKYFYALKRCCFSFVWPNRYIYIYLFSSLRFFMWAKRYFSRKFFFKRENPQELFFNSQNPFSYA
jgi:hypothetical protein